MLLPISSSGLSLSRPGRGPSSSNDCWVGGVGWGQGGVGRQAAWPKKDRAGFCEGELELLSEPVNPWAIINSASYLVPRKPLCRSSLYVTGASDGVEAPDEDPKSGLDERLVTLELFCFRLLVGPLVPGFGLFNLKSVSLRRYPFSFSGECAKPENAPVFRLVETWLALKAQQN